MQNLFKNKLFIILSLFIILIIFISSSCFAFEDSVEINYPSNILSDNIKGFIVLSNDNISLWTFDSSCYIYSVTEENGHTIVRVFMTSNTSMSFNRYNFDNNTFDFIREQNYGEAVTYPIDTYYNSILFYNVDNPNNISVPIAETPTLVFQGAPQAQGEVVQVELMKPTQVQEIPQQIVSVVMIILPIFLGIFGVLLVLYLIKSKNLLQL